MLRADSSFDPPLDRHYGPVWWKRRLIAASKVAPVALALTDQQPSIRARPTATYLPAPPRAGWQCQDLVPPESVDGERKPSGRSPSPRPVLIKHVCWAMSLREAVFCAVGSEEVSVLLAPTAFEFALSALLLSAGAHLPQEICVRLRVLGFETARLVILGKPQRRRPTGP